MQVAITASTPDPLKVISDAAGCCYGKTDYSEKRVRNCIERGHLSVVEHVSATFRIEGVSRACSHQLVRHRLMSVSQMSQRFCKVDTDSDDWYVVPPSFGKSGESVSTYDTILFKASMKGAADDYAIALNRGIKPEDARYLLPEATKTTLTVTMNLREIMHFMDVRDTKQAQWEIRDLARAMRDALKELDGWRELMEMGEA